MLEAIGLIGCVCLGLFLAYLAVAFAFGILIGIVFIIKTLKTLWYDWRINHER